MNSMNSSLASLNNLRFEQQTTKKQHGGDKQLTSPLTFRAADLLTSSSSMYRKMARQSSGEKEADDVSTGIFSRRQRVYLTVCLYLSFTSLGMLCNALGPTLVHISYMFGVDIETISLTFTFEWCGYLFGSLACGLFYDHFNEELQFTLFTFLMGVTNMLTPWASDITWFYAFKAFSASTMGYIDVMAQAYIISIWKGHRIQQAMHQTMMTIYAIGATAGPLIIAPFLVELPDESELCSSRTTEAINALPPDVTSTMATSTIDDVTQEVAMTSSSNDTCLESVPGVELVRYAYAVIGFIPIVWSLFFLVAFWVATPSCARVPQRKPNAKASGSGSDALEKKHFKCGMLLVIFLLTMVHTFIIVPGWISSFVIKGLSWSAKSGPLMTSVYWFSNILGRIVSIPLSLKMSPRSMVTMYMTSTSFMLLLTLYLATNAEQLLWLGVGLVGFCLATTFGTTIMWTAQYIAITGAVSSVLVCGFSAGVMSAGYLSGYLFQKYTPYWVLYLSILASFGQLVLFGVANLFVKCFKPNKQEKDIIVIVDE